MRTLNQSATMAPKKQRINTGVMIRISLFAALAFVVMYLEFPIAAMFPAFLQIDLSDVVVFIGGMTMGPMAVVFIELIKNLLHLLLRGGTGGVGELANFLVGVALILPPVIVYGRRKTVLSLIVGLVLGIVTMVVVGAVGNYFIFLPFYGVSSEDLIGSIAVVYAPFNLVKGTIVAVTAFVLHQSIKDIYKYIYEPRDL